MKIREKRNCFLCKIPKQCFIIIQVVLFSVWQITALKEEIIFKLLSLVCEYSTHILGAFMAFYVLQWLAEKVNWKNNRIFTILSKYSMTIYLFHQQVIYYTISWFNGKINPFFNALVNFIVALMGAFLINSVLMKFKWTRILIGEKK